MAKAKPRVAAKFIQPIKEKSSGKRVVRDPSNQQDIDVFSSKIGDCKFDLQLLKRPSSVASDADLARSEFWIEYDSEETASNFDISMLFVSIAYRP